MVTEYKVFMQEEEVESNTFVNTKRHIKARGDRVLYDGFLTQNLASLRDC